MSNMRKLSSQDINQYGLEHTPMKAKWKTRTLARTAENNQIIELVMMFVYYCYQILMIFIKPGETVVNQILIK